MFHFLIFMGKHLFTSLCPRLSLLVSLLRTEIYAKKDASKMARGKTKGETRFNTHNAK